MNRNEWQGSPHYVDIQSYHVSDGPLITTNAYSCYNIVLSDGERTGVSHILSTEDPTSYIEGMLKQLNIDAIIEGMIITGNTPTYHDSNIICAKLGIDVITYFPQSLPIYVTPEVVLPDIRQDLILHRAVVTNPPHRVTIYQDEHQEKTLFFSSQTKQL